VFNIKTAEKKNGNQDGKKVKISLICPAIPILISRDFCFEKRIPEIRVDQNYVNRVTERDTPPFPL